eukprot:7098088-Alexandrium_andersonii.AAC.1
MLCRNLVSYESSIADESGAKLLTCSLVHEHEMDFATGDDIRGTARRLAAHSRSDAVETFR